MTTPVPDRAWSASIKAMWDDYWASESAKRLPVTAKPAVHRLFGWYHLRERVSRSVMGPKTKLVVEGSTGQPKVSPLLGELRAIDTQIEALERRIFGAEVDRGDPQAVASDPGAVLAAVNARWAELVAQSPIDTDDPRLELLPGGASAAG